jgi:hypothetical protein
MTTTWSALTDFMVQAEDRHTYIEGNSTGGIVHLGPDGSYLETLNVSGAIGLAVSAGSLLVAENSAGIASYDRST